MQPVTRMAPDFRTGREHVPEQWPRAARLRNNRTVQTVSLFSGCGGSDLGAKRAGAQVVFANDISPVAGETYRRHKNLVASDTTEFMGGDIREVKNFPACELLLGCYPCQSFTMGGPRSPRTDPNSVLYQEFLRALRQVKPQYFVVENVAGMQWLEDGRYLREQVDVFREAGEGYEVSVKLLNARDYGVPADRKRVFLVGVRRDLGQFFWFPAPTHGPRSTSAEPHLAHGEAIRQLRLDAAGEYYDYRVPEESWWYMSRNRKRPWDSPSYTIVGNWRHEPLHPASPLMRMVSSNLKDASKQVWEFSASYDPMGGQPERPRLAKARRLSWRECAALQTFPAEFDPAGSVEQKFRQIGNAVPPKLMEAIVCRITTGAGLRAERPGELIDELAGQQPAVARS